MPTPPRPVVAASAPSASAWSTTGHAVGESNCRPLAPEATRPRRSFSSEHVEDLAIFGSSAFTASLLQAGVVDELRVLVNPILLGGGVSLFTGLTERVELRHARTITFRNGNVLLCYTPEAQ
jgi:dihydrofolate reductase